jgi:hypothetical protein
MQTILSFYGNQQRQFYLYTDNQAAEHIATQPTMNEHSRSIDIRHHAVRQDYLAGKVQIMGVRTDANPSDILTKFLPLNIQFTTTTTPNTSMTESTTTSSHTYTQNGNFIHTRIPQSEPRTASRRLIADGRMDSNGIHRKGPSHIRPRLLLNTCSFPPQQQTKKQRQKQRQHYWDHIHRLRNLNPQLSIKPKTQTQFTSPRSHSNSELSCSPQSQQPLHSQGPHPHGSQIPTPPHHSSKYMRNGRIRCSHRQQGKLHTIHRNQTLQHHHVPTTSRHDLPSPTTFTRTQRKKIKKWLTTQHNNHPLTHTILPRSPPLVPPKPIPPTHNHGDAHPT